MEWIDEGIVLGVKRHGETSIILELMTRAHGRHLGLVRGGSGPRLRGILQPGNTVRATWRARLDEHLGLYLVEAANLRAAGFLDKAHALHGVTHLAALCRLLAEREPHTAIYDALQAILDRLEDLQAVAPMIARFELDFLAELGFGLDLAACAATGVTDDLIFVSPRSGRAVSRAAGEPYRDKLMRLPVFLRQVFLRQDGAPPSPEDLADAFVLTGFFLDRHAFAPRGVSLPEARAHFVSVLAREAQSRQAR
ncbi:MAG: DNA repair protein RecO [Xanthobacteraceae bacterium]|jgi:DNA repair protein RecO (recombination protein O)